MKIVATTTRDKFLVEADEDELAKVMGFTYQSSIQPRTRFEIGTELKVSAAWYDLQRYRDAKDRIVAAAEVLNACASLAKTSAEAYVLPPEDKLP